MNFCRAFGRFAGVFSVFFLSVVGILCLSNFPRAWWQELINSTAPVWCCFLLGILVLLVVRWQRQRLSPFLIITVGCGAVCFVITALAVWPYYSCASVPSDAISRAQAFMVLVVDCTGGEGAHDLAEHTVEQLHPDVIVAVQDSGATCGPVKRIQGIVHELASDVDASRRVTVISRFPFLSSWRHNLGHGALPGVFGALQVDQDAILEIGAIDLIPVRSQESFGSDRVTSRRLATLIKFSERPRMVVGAFRGSPTSQIVKMYVDELHLHSVFFNGGMARIAAIFREAIGLGAGLNVFASNDVATHNVTEYAVDPDGFSGVSFEVHVPRRAQGVSR